MEKVGVFLALLLLVTVDAFAILVGILYLVERIKWWRARFVPDKLEPSGE